MTLDELWRLWPHWAVNRIVAGDLILAGTTPSQMKELEAMASCLRLVGGPGTQLAPLVEVEDNINHWIANTPHLTLLRLYRQLNALGYRMAGIEAAIRVEERKMAPPVPPKPPRNP